MFNVATSPAMLARTLGVGPDALLGLGGAGVVRERRQIRRELISRRDPRGLMEEAAAMFARPASDTVRGLANTHWMAPITRLLDSTSTNGGNILPRVDIEDVLYALI